MESKTSEFPKHFFPRKLAATLILISPRWMNTLSALGLVLKLIPNQVGILGRTVFLVVDGLGCNKKNSSIRVRLIMAAATIISYCLAWFDWWLTGCFGWDWRIRGPPYRVCFIFGEQAGNGKKTQPRPQEDTPPEKLRWLSGWKIMISNKEE